VIDASVMRAAGTPDRVDSRAPNCRDFLMAVRRICHRVILTPGVRSEWDKHQSRFALSWRVSMVSIRKVDLYSIDADDELRRSIAEVAPDESVARVMLKDAHLIEAALAADRIIASLDDVVRGHFSRASARVDSLSEIVWVNPNSTAEGPIRWLEDGAKDDSRRKLGFIGS
jgi:hypothetical protein